MEGGICPGNGPLGAIFYFSYQPAKKLAQAHRMAFLYAETVPMVEELLCSCLETLQKALKVLESSSDCQPAAQYFVFWPLMAEVPVIFLENTLNLLA